MAASLFISYRRTQAAQVDAAAAALRAAGLDVFVDRDDIDPLADFPKRIRDAIGRSHVMLVWWSADYAESDACLQELTLGWQHARRHSSDVARRIWVLNPQPTAHHIDAGELGASNFLQVPMLGQEADWAGALARRAEGLIPEGPLADERDLEPAVTLAGVPHVNQQFTGRGRELWKLHSLFHPARIGGQARRAMVQTHGLGGVGKTELAAAYVDRFAQAYPGGVFWLTFAAYETTTTSIESAEAAWLSALETALRKHSWMHVEPPLLHLKDAEGKTLPAARVRAQLQQLLRAQPSLWVLDNVPAVRPLDLRERILADWSAPSPEDRTLVTTRDGEVAAGFGVVELEVLAEDDAARMLARYQRPTDDSERQAATELVREVGAHALALTLVGEQLRNQSYTQVRESIRKRGAVPRLEQLTKQLRPLLGEGARGIIATFEVSVKGLNEPARRLLALASVCLPGEPIPRGLLEQAAMELRALQPQVATEAPNPDDLADETAAALRELFGASLLSARQGNDAPILHALLAHAIPALLPSATGAAAALRAACIDALLDRLSKASDIREHGRMHGDLPHARHLLATDTSRATIPLALSIGAFETAQGRYAAAADAERIALGRAHTMLGVEDETKLTCMNNLAETIRAQGDLPGARSLHEHVLAVRRRVLGEEHDSTLQSMANLASTLQDQGDLPGARRLERRVLAVRRRTLGEEHPDTLISMNNLAETMRAHGDLAGARSLQEQVLAVRRRVSGEEHPGTLRSMNNLATTLWEQGDLAGARSLLEPLLAVRRRILGEEHPNTLTSLANLAEAIRAQGDLAGARSLQGQVLAVRRRTLGEEHPDTLTSMNNLAYTLWAQGDLAGARSLQEQVLAVRRRTLGEEHPFTVHSMNNLATTLWAQGDLAGARSLLEQALLVSRRVLGEEHHDTLTFMNNLAETIRTQGDLHAARSLHERSLAVRRRTLGEEHPDTLTSMNNLAETIVAQGELAAGRSLHEQVLAVRRRTLGEEHPDTLTSMNNLAEATRVRRVLPGAPSLHE